MNLETIIELNQRYIILFVLFLYSILFIIFSKNWKTERKLSKTIVLAWGKILSFLYIFNFPLLLYFFTMPGADFQKFMLLIIIVYSVTYIILIGVFNIFSLEALARLIQYLTGYDLPKKLRLKKIKW